MSSNIPPYFIEKLTFPNGDTEDIGKAIISCTNHYECIEVVGTKYDLTKRVIDTLNGLNSNTKQ